MPANHFWNIDFGAYSLSVNRRNLSYSLTETQTGTVWATDFPIGSVEITERETGITARYGFGELQMVSLSEKSGATGKRILFGLDAPGRIPVDVYLTCTEREIQLTVEASRDTKTHRVERVILLPGLCYVPDDGTSYLVIPQGEGTILFANNAPNETIPLPVWDADAGLTMPFIGAVRAAYPPDCPSAESCPPAPASGGVDAGEGASSATTYLREVSPLADDGRPTQRVPAGGGGQLSAGRQPNAGGQTTAGGRSFSALALLTDSAYAVADLSRTKTGATLDFRYDRDPERRRLDVRIALIPGGDHVAIARAYRDKTISDGGHVTLRKKMRDRPAVARWIAGDWEPDTAVCVTVPALLGAANRWQVIDDFTQTTGETGADTVRVAGLCGDWAAPLVDTWRYAAAPRLGVAVPLISVVHHDATPLCFTIGDYAATPPAEQRRFLRALLHVGQLALALSESIPYIAVLVGLHEKSAGAFLVAHRFLTTDFAVEEAHYSNGVRIVINGSATSEYETADLHLPPLGFHVACKEMTAHFAWRVGSEIFSGAAWHVREARDGKPLAQSGDVCEQSFPVA